MSSKENGEGARPPVTYIATATEGVRGFYFMVLASNARHSESAGTYRDFTEGKEAIEQKYGKVTWVSPYRFMKEVTACELMSFPSQP